MVRLFMAVLQPKEASNFPKRQSTSLRQGTQWHHPSRSQNGTNLQIHQKSSVEVSQRYPECS